MSFISLSVQKRTSCGGCNSASKAYVSDTPLISSYCFHMFFIICHTSGVPEMLNY
ncbi:hypothetical protein HanRHA438_Chr06g0280831 [Helianthus annuus]|nr:hypothetical protein HanRHA438_Chr06g0280831 [Helianthus annuus]